MYRHSTILLIINICLGATYSAVNDNNVEKDEETKIYSYHVRSTVQHRYSQTLITSKVGNNGNISREISFTTLIPEYAFITSFLMEINGRIYRSYVRKRKDIGTDDTGDKDDMDVYNVLSGSEFKISVPVDPNQNVTFSLTYEQLLRSERFIYNLPIVIDPGQVIPDLKVEVKIVESTPIKSLQITKFRNYTADEVWNPNTENIQAVIEFPTQLSANIFWKPSQDQQKLLSKNGLKGQVNVQYELYRYLQSGETVVNGNYFAQFFSPDSLPPIKKHVIFVLDTLGSVLGKRIIQLQDAMQIILSKLRYMDTFSLIAFGKKVMIWSPDDGVMISNTKFMDIPSSVLVPVTDENVNMSMQFIYNLDASYVSNIQLALTTAIQVAQVKQNAPLADPHEKPEKSIIIFISDGTRTLGEKDPDKIIKHVLKANKDINARIFCLGFHKKTENVDFLENISAHNNGHYRQVVKGPNAVQDLAKAYDQINFFCGTNVTFHYKETQINKEAVTNTKFNMLFTGSELVVAGTLKSNSLTGNITVIAEHETFGFNFDSNNIYQWPTSHSSSNTTFTERLWAYLSIQQLLDKPKEAHNTISYSEILAANRALKYSFVTPVTSLVLARPMSNETGSDTADVGKFGKGFLDRDCDSLNFWCTTSHRRHRRHKQSKKSKKEPEAVTRQRLQRIAETARAISDMHYETIAARHIRDFLLASGTFPLRVVNLTDIIWIHNNTMEILLPSKTSSNLKQYKLARNEPNKPYDKCWTAAGGNGHCRHFNFCALNVFWDIKEYYMLFQCKIKNTFAGVCCPNRLQPVDTGNTTTILQQQEDKPSVAH